MAVSYLQSCIMDALIKAKGNETKAKQLIAAQALEDEKLLLALAKPHLSGIIAHAIGRVVIGQKGKKTAIDDVPPVPKSSKSGKNENEFGLNLLKALGGHNVPKFGAEDAAPRMGKKAASQQHINALKLIAAKSKTTKKRT